MTFMSRQGQEIAAIMALTAPLDGILRAVRVIVGVADPP